MHHYICIYGCMAIAAAAYLGGLSLGWFMAWTCICLMPTDEPKARGWREVKN